MTSKEYYIIMGYFDKKGIKREELEKLLDFKNLTMDENAASDILKLLTESPDTESDPQQIIRAC